MAIDSGHSRDIVYGVLLEPQHRIPLHVRRVRMTFDVHILLGVQNMERHCLRYTFSLLWIFGKGF